MGSHIQHGTSFLDTRHPPGVLDSYSTLREYVVSSAWCTMLHYVADNDDRTIRTSLEAEKDFIFARSLVLFEHALLQRDIQAYLVNGYRHIRSMRNVCSSEVNSPQSFCPPLPQSAFDAKNDNLVALASRVFSLFVGCMSVCIPLESGFTSYSSCAEVLHSFRHKKKSIPPRGCRSMVVHQCGSCEPMRTSKRVLATNRSKSARKLHVVNRKTVASWALREKVLVHLTIPPSPLELYASMSHLYGTSACLMRRHMFTTALAIYATNYSTIASPLEVVAPMLMDYTRTRFYSSWGSFLPGQVSCHFIDLVDFLLDAYPLECSKVSDMTNYLDARLRDAVGTESGATAYGFSFI